MTLWPDNAEIFEGLSFSETIAYLENIDDDYYTAIPTTEELALIYSDPNGNRYYSTLDLCLHYQRRYIADKN